MDYHTIAEAQADGAVTENIGKFFQTIVNFFIIAVALFFFVRGIETLRRFRKQEKDKTTKECPYCYQNIHLKATRCHFCTSVLSENTGKIE